MKQRVLVLGANGFIGKRVVDALHASNWASPISSGRRAAPAGRPDYVQLDANDAHQLRKGMEGVTGVVNCVLGDSRTIVTSARALAEVAGSLQAPPRVIHISSMAVYGAAEGDLDESAAPMGDLSDYGTAKLESERLLAGTSAVILRPGIVYGPGSSQWSERIARLLQSRRLGDLGSGGDGCCNLVYIGDAVAALLSALRLPTLKSGIFNLSLPQPPTWNEYFTMYAKALGAVPVSRITGRRLRMESKILAPPLKVAEVLVHRLTPRFSHLLPPPMPPSLIRLFKQEIRLKVGAVEKALDVHWTPIEEGLRQSAAYYR